MPHAAGAPVWVSAGGLASTLIATSRGTDGLAAFDEAWLQDIIHNHPECLPIAQIEPGFGRPVSACKELPITAGYVDNLLLTPEGNLVLVELKLWRNGEARREVVAQTLDYASTLFTMDYSGLEGAVGQSITWKGKPPPKLHQLFPDDEAPDPTTFIDAVNTNLKRGRIFVLVVGDGIRTETERLSSFLQSHAGARFTFALIQLGVYAMPDGLGHLIVPHTLLQTNLVERGVILIDDRRSTVLPPPALERLQNRRTTITEEQFYEAMAALDRTLPDKLKSFVSKAQNHGVRADFRASLNLMLDIPTGSAINLGYIQRDGSIWTSVANSGKSAPVEIGHAYNEELAAALGVELNKQHWSIWGSRRSLRIVDIDDRLDEWLPVIDKLMQRIVAWNAAGSSMETETALPAR